MGLGFAFLIRVRSGARNVTRKTAGLSGTALSFYPIVVYVLIKEGSGSTP